MNSILQKIPLILPSSASKLVWDCIIVINICYFIFSIPIMVAFNLSQSNIINHNILGIMKTLLFLDILINLNTGYFYKGTLIKNRIMIINHYFKYYAIKEFFSVLIIDIYNVFQGNNFFETNLEINGNTLDYTKIILILFFLKMTQIKKIIRKLDDRFLLGTKAQNIIKLFKLLL